MCALRAVCGEVHYRGRIYLMAARSEDQCASPWTNTRPAALLLPPRLAPVSSVSLLLPLSVPAQRQRRRDRQRDSETMRERRRETGKGVERGGGGDGGTGCCPLRLAGCARQDQAPWKMEMWVGLLAQKRRISRWPGLTAQVAHSGLCQHREIERDRQTDRHVCRAQGGEGPRQPRSVFFLPHPHPLYRPGWQKFFKKGEKGKPASLTGSAVACAKAEVTARPEGAAGGSKADRRQGVPVPKTPRG